MEEKKELAVVETLPVITERLEEVSKDIKERTSRAMSLVVSEENYKEIKKIRAEFNKEFADYETLRKTIKKKIMEKYDEFEIRYNELIGNAFKNAENEFKTKISETEYKIISEKEKELKFYFDEYSESLHLNNLIKWEQLGIKVKLSDSDKKLRVEIKNKLYNIAKDLEIIKLEGDLFEAILYEYLECFDFAKAKLTVTNRIKKEMELQEHISEKEKKEQIEKVLEQKVDDEITVPVETVDNSVQILTTKFEVSGTKEQLIVLKQFMIKNNIEFKSIE